MNFAEKANRIFWNTVQFYHETDDIDSDPANPFAEGTVEHTLFALSWIDTVLWHIAEIAGDPHADPQEVSELHGRADELQHARTETEKELEAYFSNLLTGSDGTAAAEIGRLSHLALKIFHMAAEVERPDAPAEYVERCRAELRSLLEQRIDITADLDPLPDAKAAGG